MGILDDAIREHLDLKRRRGADPSEVERLEREALGPVRRGPQEVSDLLIDGETAPSAYPIDEEVSSAGSYPADEELPAWTDSPRDPEPFDHGAEPSLDEATSEHWVAPPAMPQELDEPSESMYPAPESPYEPSPSAYEAEPAAEPERKPEVPRHHEIAAEWEAHERRDFTVEPAGIEPDSPAPAPPPPSAEKRLDAPDFEHETAEYSVEEESVKPEAAEPREGDDVLEETPDFLQDTPDHDRLWFEQRPPRDFDFDG